MLAFNISNDLFIQYSPSVEVSTTKKKKKKKKRINQACLQNVYLQAGSRHSFIFSIHYELPPQSKPPVTQSYLAMTISIHSYTWLRAAPPSR
jgi:hypothetical protein